MCGLPGRLIEYIFHNNSIVEYYLNYFVKAKNSYCLTKIINYVEKNVSFIQRTNSFKFAESVLIDESTSIDNNRYNRSSS
jgi:hypothetical protein